MSVIVTLKDMRVAKMCKNGTQAFFVRHGMDWRKFCREGLPEEVFLATGDAQAAYLVEVARGRQV